MFVFTSPSGEGPRLDTSSAAPSSTLTVDQYLPPKVEITVESLNGIIWSTPTHFANRDEVAKHIPFVTATVEFSGTCTNMKVHSASKFPHSRQPAVESYFASLSPDLSAGEPGGSGEVKKIISTTTQEVGGAKTTTTTTTITTIQGLSSFSMKQNNGQHTLMAKWQDQSTNEEKLVDSITYFTTPSTCDGAEDSRAGGAHSKPHLTLTLPSAMEQHNVGSFFTPCHRAKANNTDPEHKKHSDDLRNARTHSTAASTSCSVSSFFLSPSPALSRHAKKQKGKPGPKMPSLSVLELGSLLDDDSVEDDKFADIKPSVTRQVDDADVTPVIATKQSKELAATAIATEPSSGVVGRRRDANRAGILSPISTWMSCNRLTRNH